MMRGGMRGGGQGRGGMRAGGGMRADEGRGGSCVLCVAVQSRWEGVEMVVR